MTPWFDPGGTRDVRPPLPSGPSSGVVPDPGQENGTVVFPGTRGTEASHPTPTGTLVDVVLLQGRVSAPLRKR